jgi:PAS domain S-box-containing protein
MTRRTLVRKADHPRTSSKCVHARRPGRGSSEEIIFPLALEVGRIGIFQTDLRRKLTSFSPELCNLLGLPVGTVMSYAESSCIIHEDDRVRVQAEIEKAIHASDLGHWVAECRLRRADGTIRWAAISGRRIYRHTASGLRPVRSVGTVVDITPLKETEFALRESEQRLRLALEAARMGTFEADVAATEARIDAQEARLLGLPEDTRVVPIELLRERVVPADLRASDAKQQRMNDGEAYHHEFRLRMPDGSVRWLSAHADIRSNRIFGVNFEITRRKLAEEALAQSEARLRTATNAAALGVFEWDPVSDVASWGNDRIYKIFGRTFDDGPLSRAKFVSEYLHPNDRAEFDTALDKAVRTRGHFHVTCRFRRRRGRLRWLEMEAKYEKATGERPARFIGVVADVTNRMGIARRAQRLSQHLLTIQEEERRSIAQELHDSTVQHLVATSFVLTTLSQQHGRRFEKAVATAEYSLQEAMREIRTFSYLMHAPALHRHGLYKMLAAYIAGFADRSGLFCKLRMDRMYGGYPALLQRSILRIVQEGLANAYRQASASQVSVDIRRLGARLHVVIANNGQGINRGQHQRLSRGGGGLRGIRMRVTHLGGRLRISASPTGGLRLHAVLPTDNLD